MVTLLFLAGLFGLGITVYLVSILTVLAAFYLWRWIFKRYIAAGNIKKMAGWMASLFAVPLIYLGLTILFLFVLPYGSSKSFDKKQWQADEHKRYQMADDLVKSKILIGKDAQTVKQLLGEATWKDKPSEEWTYDMGMGHGGLGFEFHNLIVKFNRGRVTAVSHEKISE